MTIDQAIRDLLDLSTDITSLVVLDEAGAVVAAGPGAPGDRAADAVGALWAAAERRAGQAGEATLEHVVVPVAGGAVAMLEAHGHRAVAVTRPQPALGLLLFDLRTCLADAYAAPEEAP